MYNSLDTIAVTFRLHRNEQLEKHIALQCKLYIHDIKM